MCNAPASRLLLMTNAIRADKVPSEQASATACKVLPAPDASTASLQVGTEVGVEFIYFNYITLTKQKMNIVKIINEY